MISDNTLPQVQESNSENSLIVRQCYDFYRALIDLKVKIKHIEEKKIDPNSDQYHQLIQTAHETLSKMLAKNIEDVYLLGWGYSFEEYKEAQYLMAVLADEILINLNWAGRETWTSQLLEHALFETSNAGDIFFEKLNDLLRRSQASKKELAKVYLFALSLGFQGKFRGKEDSVKIGSYKKALYYFIFGKHIESKSVTSPLVPTAYAYTIRSDKLKLRPWLNYFYGALIAVFVIYLIAGEIIWASTTNHLRDVVNDAYQYIDKIWHVQ